MYHLPELLGKVVTVKTNRGDELVASLTGLNEQHTVLTLSDVRVVAISDGQVMLLPYIFTATTDSLFVPVSSLFTVTETLADAASDYLAMIAEQAGGTLPA
jgi:small nuclear ribonucleoprotein (snRNP)-like protein